MSSAALIGLPAPAFQMPAVCADEVRTASLGDYVGRWLMLIFYPRDFSFVCPTELTSFSERIADFATRDCQLLGISVDSIETHRDWLATSLAEG